MKFCALRPMSLRKRTFRGRKNRGIGILAHEETNLIGWKPLPLLLAHAYGSKSKEASVLTVSG